MLRLFRSRVAGDAPVTPGGRQTRRHPVVPTVVLLLGAVYCLLPVAWVVIASTKSRAELFSTFSFSPSFTGGFTDNLSELTAYKDGQFWTWCLNSALYAGGGALLSVVVSAMAGFALAKYVFPGRQTDLRHPAGRACWCRRSRTRCRSTCCSPSWTSPGSYWSVLLPGVISPFGIYLCRIYAGAAVPDEALEAARLDGASEWRAFTAIAMPMMVPGLITVFLLQFVGVWNNFLLPYIMLTDPEKFPLTVGLYSLLAQGSDRPALYTLVITGALLSVIPLIALFLVLQRYWRVDLISGGLKG